MFKIISNYFKEESIVKKVSIIIFILLTVSMLSINYFYFKDTDKLKNNANKEIAFATTNSILPYIKEHILDEQKLKSILSDLQSKNPNFLYILITKNGNYYLHKSVYKGFYSTKTTKIELNIDKNFKIHITYDNKYKTTDNFYLNSLWWENTLIFLILYILILLVLLQESSFLKKLTNYMFKYTKKLSPKLKYKENEIQNIKNIFENIIDINSSHEIKLKVLNMHLEELIETKTMYLRDEIHEKKIVEKQLKSSLDEKVLLLKEIHHRVKNNLAVITGLIRMQTRQIKDDNLKILFTDLQNRIKTMELIHTNLYRSEDFSNINMQKYLILLSDNLLKWFNTKETTITFNVQCNDIFLNIDQAIACGQIVNELITNAFKHAFIGRKEGNIKIEMNLNNEICGLMVEDDGIGKLEHKISKPSLGLSLVDQLVHHQLRGSLLIENEIGQKYKIFFEKK